MTCREVVDFLMDYVSDVLPPAQRAVFEQHLGECPDCVAYVRSYRDTVSMERQAFSEATSPEVPDALVQAILAARRTKG
jgi:anti-sigma factor RsiW